MLFYVFLFMKPNAYSDFSGLKQGSGEPTEFAYFYPPDIGSIWARSGDADVDMKNGLTIIRVTINPFYNQTVDKRNRSLISFGGPIDRATDVFFYFRVLKRFVSVPKYGVIGASLAHFLVPD